MELNDLEEYMLKTCCAYHQYWSSDRTCHIKNDGFCQQLNIFSHVPITMYCPICFSNNCYNIGLPPKDEKDHWVWDEGIVKCLDCKWDGFYPELLHVSNKEEIKNLKRTKLIDKFLDF
jgi:hypothetical protein